MKALRNRIARRASYLVVLIALMISGCGVGRYNNQVNAMKWPTNTTYYYSTNGNLIGSSVGYK